MAILPVHGWSFIVINDVYETHDAVSFLATRNKNVELSMRQQRFIIRRIFYVKPKVSRTFAFARISSEICCSLYVERKIYGDWFCWLIL